MRDPVFYCPKCDQAFSGEGYQETERPRCPSCNTRTWPIRKSKEQWLALEKAERQTILEQMKQKAQQQEQKEAQRKETAIAAGITYEGEDTQAERSETVGLYANIGKKIKIWAKVSFIMGAIGYFIAGLVVLAMAEYDTDMIIGFATLIGGPFIAWVSSWCLYGFGELIDKTSENEKHTKSILALMLEEKTKENKQ